MAHYFSKILPIGFDEAVQRTTDVFQREGFGMITEIDLKQSAKIGVNFLNCHMLCNRKLTHEALQTEGKIGTMLPCKMVVQEIGSNRTEIAAIDPVASMQASDNPRLKQVAERVHALLWKVVEALYSSSGAGVHGRLQIERRRRR